MTKASKSTNLYYLLKIIIFIYKYYTYNKKGDMKMKDQYIGISLSGVFRRIFGPEIEIEHNEKEILDMSEQIKNLQKVLESPKAIEMFATKEIEVQKEKVDNFSTSIKQEQIKLDKQLRLEADMKWCSQISWGQIPDGIEYTEETKNETLERLRKEMDEKFGSKVYEYVHDYGDAQIYGLPSEGIKKEIERLQLDYNKAAKTLGALIDDSEHGKNTTILEILNLKIEALQCCSKSYEEEIENLKKSLDKVKDITVDDIKVILAGTKIQNNPDDIKLWLSEEYKLRDASPEIKDRMFKFALDLFEKNKIYQQRLDGKTGDQVYLPSAGLFDEKSWEFEKSRMLDRASTIAINLEMLRRALPDQFPKDFTAFDIFEKYGRKGQEFQEDGILAEADAIYFKNYPNTDMEQTIVDPNRDNGTI